MSAQTQFSFRLFACLPLPAAHLLGGFIGLLLWLLPNKFSRLTRFHIARCFPALSWLARQGLVFRALIESGKALAEGPVLWAGPEQRVARLVRGTRGAEAIEQALLAGKGVITAAPHLGSWEMAGLEYSRLHPIVSLYKPQKGAWDALIKQGRERFGAKLVPSNRGGVRALLASLKRGETAGILPDQDPPPGSGAFAPFFGIPAHTPSLLTTLARRTSAKVFYMYAERLSWGRGFILHFVPAPAEVADADEVCALAALNLGVEDCVCRLPAQYWWGYARWRRRPHGEADFYPWAM
ncbi:MAG: lysophospholipid acyltransferase family protein [Nevskiales bacterium]